MKQKKKCQNKKGLLIKIPHFNPLIFQFVILQKKMYQNQLWKARERKCQNQKKKTDPQAEEEEEENESEIQKNI